MAYIPKRCSFTCLCSKRQEIAKNHSCLAYVSEMDESSLIDWVFAHDPFLVFALGFIIVHEITFVGGSLFLAAIDYFDLSPESKIQKVTMRDKLS